MSEHEQRGSQSHDSMEAAEEYKRLGEEAPVKADQPEASDTTKEDEENGPTESERREADEVPWFEDYIDDDPDIDNLRGGRRRPKTDPFAPPWGPEPFEEPDAPLDQGNSADEEWRPYERPTPEWYADNPRWVILDHRPYRITEEHRGTNGRFFSLEGIDQPVPSNAVDMGPYPDTFESIQDYRNGVDKYIYEQQKQYRQLSSAYEEFSKRVREQELSHQLLQELGPPGLGRLRHPIRSLGAIGRMIDGRHRSPETAAAERKELARLRAELNKLTSRLERQRSYLQHDDEDNPFTDAP